MRLRAAYRTCHRSCGARRLRWSPLPPYAGRSPPAASSRSHSAGAAVGFCAPCAATGCSGSEGWRQSALGRQRALATTSASPTAAAAVSPPPSSRSPGWGRCPGCDWQAVSQARATAQGSWRPGSPRQYLAGQGTGRRTAVRGSPCSFAATRLRRSGRGSGGRRCSLAASAGPCFRRSCSRSDRRALSACRYRCRWCQAPRSCGLDLSPSNCCYRRDP
mmetsp:Transcript_34355/g.79435  ORF Transcript_34355/g.79435 Transcript_34355/m.79435 type:complete len:218 (-) Transcript_34355:278-931(-)